MESKVGGENGKGCDSGYALAANSCEGVTGVDACTVAAFDAVTAFAVPDLGGHLATPSIFSGLAGIASRLAHRPLSLLQVGNGLVEPPLFDRRLWTCDFGYALATNSCERVAGVDACTVAALDAITAFAVPNLGGHLATPSIFSGLADPRVASLTYRSTYFKRAIFRRALSFRPSTKAILIHGVTMSTPKVCALKVIFVVNYGGQKMQQVKELVGDG